MQCELCGRECECRPATVDGVRMMLCPNCLRQHGKKIETSSAVSGVKTPRPILARIKKPGYRDVYKEMQGNKELVSDWNKVIREARKKKGLSREDLGFRIGERTVTIGKIENGDLRPSDEMINKLEKELNISLVEEIKGSERLPKSSGSGKGLTLGDFIKREE